MEGDLRGAREQQREIDDAVRNALVDRTLKEHTDHLAEVNGSQREMAASLKRVESDLRDLRASANAQTQIQLALSEAVADQRNDGFSRRKLLIGAATAFCGYLTLIVLLIVNVAH